VVNCDPGVTSDGTVCTGNRSSLPATTFPTDILYCLVFYYSTVNFNKKLHAFYPAEWFRHIWITFVFLSAPLRRWPYEYPPKHVGDGAIKLHPQTQVYFTEYYIPTDALIVYHILV